MALAQQFVGGVVGDHGDFQAIQVVEFLRLRAAVAGQDDDGEVQVRTGEGEVLLALGRGHDTGQQVELAAARLLQHCAPVARLDGFEFHAKAAFDEADIVGGEAQVVALGVAKFEGWPGRVDAQAQLRVGCQPGALVLVECQGVGRGHPIRQAQQHNGRQAEHNGLVSGSIRSQCRPPASRWQFDCAVGV